MFVGTDRSICMITRRRVIYVHGYDPMGPNGYYGLFQNQIRKATLVWGVTADVGPLTLESRDIASWTVTCRGPNWQVFTQYDFVLGGHHQQIHQAANRSANLPRHGLDGRRSNHRNDGTDVPSELEVRDVPSRAAVFDVSLGRDFTRDRNLHWMGSAAGP